MKKQALYLLLAVNFLPINALSEEYRTPVGTKCIGPVNTVKVTVDKIENGLVTDYKIEITNNGKYPIQSITFGYGEIVGFVAFENIEVTGSPENWQNSSGNYYESAYQRIVWWAGKNKETKKRYPIVPGASLAGYAVRTTVPREEYLNGATVNGIKTGPLDLSKMPFKVELNKPFSPDGSHHKDNCLWGIPTPSKSN